MKLEIVDRGHNIVSIKGKEYKIPKELTVEEIERLLELTNEVEKRGKEAGKEDPTPQVREFTDVLVTQIFFILSHYQEITEAFIRRTFSVQEMVDIAKFFSVNRFLQQPQDQKKK